MILGSGTRLLREAGTGRGTRDRGEKQVNFKMMFPSENNNTITDVLCAQMILIGWKLQSFDAQL